MPLSGLTRSMESACHSTRADVENAYHTVHADVEDARPNPLSSLRRRVAVRYTAESVTPASPMALSQLTCSVAVCALPGASGPPRLRPQLRHGLPLRLGARGPADGRAKGRRRVLGQGQGRGSGSLDSGYPTLPETGLPVSGTVLGCGTEMGCGTYLGCGTCLGYGTDLVDGGRAGEEGGRACVGGGALFRCARQH
eukprot:3400982-Rhodomonas_salina.2